MRVVKPPSIVELDEFSPAIFLAGSIEQGTAEEWQSYVCDALQDLDVDIYNPRRDVWQPELKQSLSEPIFAEQVRWEQYYLSRVDLVFFHFDENTKSPITLLEFGQVIGQETYAVVSCSPNFWRYGNIEVMCEDNQLGLYSNIDDAINHLRLDLEYLGA